MNDSGPRRPPASSGGETEPDDHRSTAIIVLVAAVVLAGAVFFGRQIMTPDPPLAVRVIGDGRDLVVEVEEGAPVKAALDLAEVDLTQGRLLSAADGSVLEPAYDPAIVTLDGVPTSTEAVLRRRPSIVVEVTDGTDAVEDTVSEDVDVPTPAPDGDARFVTEAGSPGRERRVSGAVSGQPVSVETLVEAVAPRRTERKVVALTFDDGPTARWTPYILAVLRDRGVVATFCIVGDTLQKNPELAHQIVEEGHALCNHSLSHDLNMVGAAQSVLNEQIHGMNQVIADMGLPHPAFYRPPGGYLSDEIRSTATSAGQKVLMWKVDTKDWSTRSTAESVMENLRTQVEPGAVILMHDGGGRDRALSISVLGPIIDELRAQGYEFTLPHIEAG